MKVEILLITPEMAAQYLEKNTHNRRLRGWWVMALAEMMRRGDYVETHQGIAFSENGNLLDGQHRLAAIVESGIPQLMAVFTGVQDRAFMVTDCGIKRNMADLTGLDKRAAETCRFAASLLISQGAVDSASVLRVADTGMGELHNKLLEYCGTQRKIITSAPMRCALIVKAMDGGDMAYSLDLYRKLATGNTEDLPPIGHAFIRQILGSKVSAISSSSSYDLLARGLKIYDKNYQSVSKIQISENDLAAAREYVRSVIRRAMNADQKFKKAA